MTATKVFHNQFGGLEDVKQIIFGCSTAAGQRVTLKCEKLLTIKKLFSINYIWGKVCIVLIVVACSAQTRHTTTLLTNADPYNKHTPL
jgi:hypothetical protein